MNKYRWLAVLGGILLLAGAFTAGRYSRPAEIKEVEKHTHTIEKTVEITQKVDLTELLKTVRQEYARLNKTVSKEVTVLPDGTRIEKEVSTDKSETGSKTEAEKESKLAQESTKKEKTAETIIVEKLKIVTNLKQPDWGLGVYTGWNPMEPTRKYMTLPVPIFVSVDRRILGSVYFSLMGSTRWDLLGGLRWYF